MFERFTERARGAVVHAQEQSRSLGHDYIGTEHLLLGLTCEEDSLAARALQSIDVTHERARAAVVRAVGLGEQAGTGQIPFTPRAKKVLELSLREALGLGDNYIGTEHILLGVLRENKGAGTDVLRDLDADVEKVRDELLRLRAETPAAEPHNVELDVEDLDLTPRVRQLLIEAAEGAREARRAEVDERDLLEAMLADQSIARVLSGLGVEVSRLRERLPHIGWSEPDAPDQD
jgi:ATP-dependent Clp protease ATP-binding subunit ClpA